MKSQTVYPDSKSITDEETGKVYIIPQGGSGEPPAAEEQQEDPPVEEEDDDDEEIENLNGEAFLNSIEEEELRERLQPHVKRWDAGVTRRFQELHSQLKPYQELGDVDKLNEAAQLYELLNTRPEDIYNALAQSLGYNVQQGQPGTQGQQPQQRQGQPNSQQPQQQRGQGNLDPTQPNGGLTNQQYAQLPPEVQNQLQQHNTILTTLAEHYLSEQKSQQQAQEDQELDNYLQNLKDEFGDFDEEFVLAKMAAGQDGAKAVKNYQRQIEKQIAARNSQGAPRGILGGGGQVPQDSVNVAELKGNDVKSLVAGLMSQAQQEGS